MAYHSEIDGTVLRLKEDIKGIHPGQVYGEKGDEVILITVHGAVCIVEDKKGNRFSAKLDSLSGLIIERKTEAVQAAAARTKTIINRAPAAKKTAAPINQPSLF
jgi:hypothetical protein